MSNSPARQPNNQPEKAGPRQSFTQSAEFQAVVEPLRGLEPAALVDSITDPNLRRFLYELFSGLGDIPKTADDPRPPWAFQAWKEFLRSSAFLPKKSGPDSNVLGHMSGLLSELSPEAKKWPIKVPAALDALFQIMPKIRELAAHAPPEEAAEFFQAQKGGKDRGAQMTQISQRTKVFMVIAVAWEQVAKFKSTGELFQWLRSLGKSGDLLAPSTDSREIRSICKKIDLRYPGRGGRPQKARRS